MNILSILISIIITITSGILINALSEIAKKKRWISDDLNVKNIVVLVLMLIVFGGSLFISSRLANSSYIDETNPAYLRQIIRAIDTSSSSEERMDLSPFYVLQNSESGENGMHGPKGERVPPDCYGLAWNVVVNNVQYTDQVVVISKPTEIEILNTPSFKGYYITVCNKENFKFSPNAFGEIQAAIMDKDYPLSHDRRWTWKVLD